MLSLRVLGLYVVVLCLSLSSAAAGLCMPPPVVRDSPYHYQISLTEALVYAKTALERLPSSNDRSDPLASASDLLLGLRIAQGDFKCAESCVREYQSSTDEAIRTSALGATGAFSILSALQDQYATEVKKLLDAGSESKIGTYLDQIAKLGSASDDSWKMLVTAAIASTYSVVEEDPDTHLMSRLSLTSQQRDEILAKLRTGFGVEVTQGMRAGQLPLLTAAAAIYQVLSEPGRTPREPVK